MHPDEIVSKLIAKNKPAKSATPLETERMAKLRRTYPWFIRPREGTMNVVEFGTVYRSNGALHGMPTGSFRNLDQSYAAERIKNCAARGDSEMHIYPDGRIVDVTPKGVFERKERSTLWEPDETQK